MLERRQLGHYNLVRRIGGGGMGEIYLAQDMRIERQVALKVVRASVDPYPDSAVTADAQRLFLREMQAITRLDHPHILPLYDFGEEHDGNLVMTYMVMPYRPEGSLADWLQRRGSANQLSFQDIAYFIIQAAEALQHAHDHALIHQDVKPSNFLVRDRSGYSLPDLLLSDFGIARVMTATVTASQSVRGTPTSMAPEQWQGQAEPATDQYALAVMAYILLVGRPPFSGRMEQLLHQHLSVQPQPPSTFHPAIPGDIDSVILAALSKQPSGRFASITAFARAFQQAASVSGFAHPFVGNPATPVPPSGDAMPQLQSAPFYPSPGAEAPASIMPYGAPDSVAPQLPPVPPMTPAYPFAGDSSPRFPVQAPAAPYATSDPAQLAPTVASNSPTPFPAQPPVVLPPVRVQSGVYPASFQEQQPAAYQPYQYSNAGLPPAPGAFPGQPARSRRSLWVLVACCLVVILIVSGIVGVSAYQNHVASVNAASTADAQSTTDAQSTANIQATVNVESTATAIASEATAQAQATVNAQASATAQVVSANPYPSYMSGSGTLVLLDPLQSPTNWQDNSDSTFGGSCQYVNGAFQVTQTQSAKIYECANNTSFGDFALEVQMTIVQGDCGGVVIRATGSQMYYFRVCSDNTYDIWKYIDNNGADATRLTFGNVTVNSGSNTIGILASGASMTLYVNQSRVDSANDGSFASGEISLTADDETNATTVSYSNIRIWQ